MLDQLAFCLLHLDWYCRGPTQHLLLCNQIRICVLARRFILGDAVLTPAVSGGSPYLFQTQNMRISHCLHCYRSSGADMGSSSMLVQQMNAPEFLATCCAHCFPLYMERQPNLTGFCQRSHKTRKGWNNGCLPLQWCLRARERSSSGPPCPMASSSASPWPSWSSSLVIDTFPLLHTVSMIMTNWIHQIDISKQLSFNLTRFLVVAKSEVKLYERSSA